MKNSNANVQSTNANQTVNNATATTKANDMLLKGILSNIDKTLLVSNKGQQKESIYKHSLFVDMTDKEKKVYRRKLRNTIDNFCNSFLHYFEQKDTKAIEKLIVAFDSFYKDCFAVNNYSFESISSENSKDTRKKDLLKMFEIIKSAKAKK